MQTYRNLKRLLSSGKIDRRQFMQGALATGVTVAAANTFVTEVGAMTPKKGGAFRIGTGHGSTTDSLDPATTENGMMTQVNFALHNCLTEVGNDGNIRAELAESWNASDDAKQWTFNLRKGVTFHNGKDVTAEDVIASFNHHRGKDSKSAAKPIVAPIKEMKADGKNTVVFELSDGNADFPFIVSDYHLTIMPAVDGKADWKSGVGAGGYTLKEFNAGVKARFERNPNYWKADHANFDTVELVSIVDVAARINALRSGEVELADRADLKTLHLLKRVPNITVEEKAGTLHYTFPMRTNIAPFDNVDVRLALKYAMNREEILKKVLLGHGALGNDHPISTANRYHASDLAQRAYDPDKAKFHLKKAGMESLKVDLSTADAAFAGAVDAAVLYKEHASKAGIDLNIVREPNDGYWSNVWNKKPFCACYWGGRPTEDWMFSTAYSDTAEWNDTVWKNARFNELLLLARKELDDAKRKVMYAEMQTLIHNDGGTIVPMFANYVWARSNKIAHNEQMAANWDLDGHKAMERWWFA